MTLANNLKKIFESVGRDNNPAYAVVAIATAKGIFRPIFTMMDKKETPETKKYAAVREGLTEVIAIPTYLTCGWLAGKGAGLFSKGNANIEKMAKQNLRFVGVCVAALLVIPGLCSICVKPFTERIFHKNDKKEEPANLNVISQAPDVKIQKPPITQTGKLQSPFRNMSIASSQNSEMRVG